MHSFINRNQTPLTIEEIAQRAPSALATRLTTDKIKGYVKMRQKAEKGNSAATINRELSVLSHMFRLGQRTTPPLILIAPPYIKKLRESSPRQGFLTDANYDNLARECSVEGLWLRAMFATACSFAWRRGEVLNLRVRQLDLPGRLIRLDVGSTKNDDGRCVRMTNEVFELLAACAVGKRGEDYVFTRDGNQRVLDFRGAWDNACERAGCPGLLFHDLRRTGARNLRRLHVAEGVIMKIGGWKTRMVFERYNIVDETDLADAASRLDEKRADMDARARSQNATKTATSSDQRTDAQDTIQ